MTKHNLSISGPGWIKSSTEDRICVFCHTPHLARVDSPYLWNRQDTTGHIPYQSTTLYASIGQPTGASKMCLSCHDGTIALGALLFPPEIPFTGGIRFIPEGPSKLGTDLSDDHPVSFVYNSTLANNNGELIQPSALPPQIRLDNNAEMQCNSCHDPHFDIHGKFLVMSDSYSALCTACHDKNGWGISTHSTSNAVWNGLGADPWPVSSYDTVSENGCKNCHVSHNAGGHERLLNYQFEEDTCLACHNGNVAATDIELQLSKQYRHPVQNYTGIHDPAEDFTSGSVTEHVECTDCHNPHWSNDNTSSGAPLISGVSEGVTGINAAGQNVSTVSNQYEICFKCHADNNVIDVMSIDRQIQQLNTRLEFDSSNPSYHPVESQGINVNVPSLLPPYTESSIIFCTDCHSSDSSEPSGPHGSIYEHLLSDNYVTLDFTSESPLTYELCYKCHDRNSLLADQSGFSHNNHVVNESTPCAACHDAHGIDFIQGNSQNNSHLINFDITIVQADSQGRLRFEDNGTFSGQCFLRCHNAAHEPLSY
ncbi:MAG: hypothetical protein JSW20_09770 [Nitrospiraceae bacterium]|nr:MAG: hypothetical protein JSW20_09770 [Nitrospiraceae bacterium]